MTANTQTATGIDGQPSNLPSPDELPAGWSSP